MQQQLKLTKEEVGGALQGFVAKVLRNKDAKINSITADADGGVTIGAELTIQPPKPRQPRKPKVAAAPHKK